MFPVNSIRCLGFAAVALVSLSACQANPTSIPHGYKFHNNIYNMKAGKKPCDIGYGWGIDTASEIEENWRVIAKDLIDSLKGTTGVIAEPIYVSSERVRTPFTITLDNYIREELINSGFTLTTSPDVGVQLTYDIRVLQDESTFYAPEDSVLLVEETEEGPETAPVIVLPDRPEGNVAALARMTDCTGNVIAEASGFYNIPGAEDYRYREPAFGTSVRGNWNMKKW